MHGRPARFSCLLAIRLRPGAPAPGQRPVRPGRTPLCLLAVAALLAPACSDQGSPTGPSGQRVVYGALGASDALGVGGSVVCVPFDPECPNGSSYAYVVKRRLESEGLEVEMAPRGWPGAVLSDTFKTLAHEIGRTDVTHTFIAQLAPFIPETTTHVSIFAGANDANVIAQAVRAGRGGSDIRAFVDQQVERFGADLRELIRVVRGKAPQARIVAMNLPNLAGAPYVAGLSATERGIVQRIAVGLTDRINALAADNVIVVDLMCDTRMYAPANYSSDGFHPSDSGYAAMADLLYPALRSGAAPAPSGSCPQRRLAPVF